MVNSGEWILLPWLIEIFVVLGIIKTLLLYQLRKWMLWNAIELIELISKRDLCDKDSYSRDSYSRLNSDRIFVKISIEFHASLIIHCPFLLLLLLLPVHSDFIKWCFSIRSWHMNRNKRLVTVYISSKLLPVTSL